MKDIEISEAISQAEKILGTTLSTTHLQMILYFMCDIGFSQEMIAYPVPHGTQPRKTSPKYMEAIGLTWAEKGLQRRRKQRMNLLLFQVFITS